MLIAVKKEIYGVIFYNFWRTFIMLVSFLIPGGWEQHSTFNAFISPAVFSTSQHHQQHEDKVILHEDASSLQELCKYWQPQNVSFKQRCPTFILQQ